MRRTSRRHGWTSHRYRPGGSCRTPPATRRSCSPTAPEAPSRSGATGASSRSARSARRRRSPPRWPPRCAGTSPRSAAPRPRSPQPVPTRSPSPRRSGPFRCASWLRPPPTRRRARWPWGSSRGGGTGSPSTSAPARGAPRSGRSPRSRCSRSCSVSSTSASSATTSRAATPRSAPPSSTRRARLSPEHGWSELSTRVTVGLDLDQLTIDADAVDLRGRAASFETVETLRRTLADAPFLTEVTAYETRATVDGRGVEFRLRAVRRPAGASS
ncbi:MAG: PilN domain-containing protein [Deltaproteobacteria bacterium]|nr:MAG: PilN domain-containing protein [Deltaproteobacteria bacterium]